MDSAAIRLRRQLADDVGGAGRLLERSGGAAGKDFAAALGLGHAGHAQRSADGEVAQVRQRGGAEHLADVGIRERVLDRHDQVVGRSIEMLDEHRRDAMLAGLDVDLRRLHRQAVRILLVHARVDVHQRHALAVDRDFDLLASIGAAEQVAGRSHVQHDLEVVFAVGREHVQHRQAAAGAERRAFDVAHLRRGARHLPGRRRRRGVAIADGEAADLAGRAQVAFHQRRGNRLRVGDVVEAVAQRVGGEIGVDVDVDREQVLHGALVLGAIEPLRRAPAGIGIECRGAIDARLERRDQRRDRRGVGALRADRRHHARAQAADHPLADVGVIGHRRRVERLERQAARAIFVAIVVAADAVLLDQCVLVGDRHCRCDRRMRHRRLERLSLSRRSRRCLIGREGGRDGRNEKRNYGESSLHYLCLICV